MLEGMHVMLTECDEMETNKKKWLVEVESMLSNEKLGGADQQRLLQMKQIYLNDEKKYRNYIEDIRTKIEELKLFIRKVSRLKTKLSFKYILKF